MNIFADRLNKLADKLQTLPRDKFDKSSFFKREQLGRNKDGIMQYGEFIPLCGAAWATVVFKDEGFQRLGYDVCFEEFASFEAIQAFFGLTEKESSLFCGLDDISPQEFAERLRDLAKGRNVYSTKS